MLRAIVFSVCVLCVSACASVALTPEQTEKADYGQYPEDYKDVVERWFYDLLKDPESAKYNFLSKPEKAYARAAPIMGGAPTHYGYLVRVNVNAKNGFGGYTGWEEYRLIIRDGKVVGRINANPYFSEPWYK